MKRALQFFILLSLFATVNGFGATARELLFSPSPSMRMFGAKVLLDQYVPPPRTNADKLMAQLQLGMSESEVAKLLTFSGATNESAETIRDGIVKTFRVDDLWVIRCSFTNAVTTNAVATNAATKNVVARSATTANTAPKKSEGGLAEVKLQQQMNQALVDPPSDFTGVWLTYWMNGVVSYERNFRNGVLDGVTTGFYPNGMASIVISYRNGVPDGNDIGYFPSGNVQYQGQYRAGQEVGHWFWYHENGSVETEKDFDVKSK